MRQLSMAFEGQWINLIRHMGRSAHIAALVATAVHYLFLQGHCREFALAVVFCLRWSKSWFGNRFCTDRPEETHMTKIMEALSPSYLAPFTSSLEPTVCGVSSLHGPSHATCCTSNRV